MIKDYKTSPGQPAISLPSQKLPFHFTINGKPSYRYHIPGMDETYSYTGVIIMLRRNSLGRLISGYYVITGIFALLSTLSYIIPPDQVQNI